MMRKTFTFTEDTIEKIESRDKNLYRKEYQFVEAAIRFFSEQHENENEILEEIHADVRAIKKAVCKNSEGVEVDKDGLPVHLVGLLD